MAGIYGLSREAVRIKVKKCEGNQPHEWRKFSVDPQITSLEVLYSLLAKAFDLKSDFSISYKTVDPNGQEVFLAVLSDWDLDAAFLRAHNQSISSGADPCLSLTVDIKPFSEATDWDAATNTTNKEMVAAQQHQQPIGVGQKYVQNVQSRLPGLIMNHMEKTFSMVTRALNFVEDQSILQPMRQPLSDAEFRSFLDSVGQIVQAKNLRKVIYNGGIDPSLRRVVWKHILNVYPDGMTGRQRMDYIKRKSAEYYLLRDVWRVAVQQGPPVSGELAYVTGMVRKDVLRTDRLHPFYAGNDDNQNIASLFNILTTYALNHPAVSYCQGMSDIASPLLVTMCDEAQAYICFCAIMKRLSTNFMLDGIAMTQKFAHLSEALQFYDPEFYEYLRLQQADDLLFCYRWLLLEMKREFAFEDSLRMLEVLWSSIPPEPPIVELSLYEKEFVPPSKDAQISPKNHTPSDVTMRTPCETAYTKLCALRRQSSSQSLLPTSPNTTTLNSTDSGATTKSLDTTKRFNQSLDENITRTNQQGENAHTRNISKSYQSLDESKLRRNHHHPHHQQQQQQHHHNENQSNTQSTETQDCDKSQVNSFEVKHNEKNQQHQSSSSPPPPPPPLLSKVSLNNNNEFNSTPNTITTTATNLNSNESTTNDQQEQQSTANNNNIPTSDNSTNASSSSTSGHFKGLKERIAAGKKEIIASIENKIEKFPFDELTKSSNSTDDGETTPKSGKIVKNFNEFLNFASKGAKLTLNRSASVSSTESRSKRASLRMTKSTHQNLDSEKANATSDTAAAEQDDLSQTDSEPNVDVINKKTLKLQLEDKKQSSFDGSSPDDSEYYPMTTSITRELRLELDNLNRQVFGNNICSPKMNAVVNYGLEMSDCNTPESAGSHISNNRSPANFQSTDISYTKFNQNSEDDAHLDKIYTLPVDKNAIRTVQGGFNSTTGLTADAGNCDLKRASVSNVNADQVFIWENPLHQISPTTNQEAPIASNKSYYSGGGGGNANGGGGVESKNPFHSKDFLQTLTPDEQTELEYDGEIIDEMTGKKSITPIRLVRRREEDDSENSEKAMNELMKTSMLSETNPFLMDLASGSLEDTAIALTESIETTAGNATDHQSESFFVDEEASEAETETTNIVLQKGSTSLPPPHEFGGGNPFLMFLCLALLLQHRNYVMKNNMDYNEMAMHFDKMIRKHNVVRVLNQARRMYADYLKSQTLQRKNSTCPHGSTINNNINNHNADTTNRVDYSNSNKAKQ